jgi:hypothetical protein
MNKSCSHLTPAFQKIKKPVARKTLMDGRKEGNKPAIIIKRRERQTRREINVEYQVMMFLHVNRSIQFNFVSFPLFLS